jgi:hypothetical protein
MSEFNDGRIEGYIKMGYSMDEAKEAVLKEDMEIEKLFVKSVKKDIYSHLKEVDTVIHINLSRNGDKMEILMSIPIELLKKHMGEDKK